MGSELDDARRWQLTSHLNAVICACLTQMKIEAEISLFRLFDVIQRWERDTVRLANEQSNGVHPVKYIAYQAFWIRKIKPVGNAYLTHDLADARSRGIQVSPTREIIDINERLSVHVAVKNLLRFAQDGLYPSEVSEATTHRTAADPEALRQYLHAYLSFPEGKRAKGTTYDNLIYNQRYRTFGPHHLTHILDQAVFGTLRAQASAKG